MLAPFLQSMPSDTCLYEPLQLKPTAILRMAMSSSTGVISRDIGAFESLHQDHGITVVILGANIECPQPVRFGEASDLSVVSTLKAVPEGAMLQSTVGIGTGS